MAFHGAVRCSSTPACPAIHLEEAGGSARVRCEVGARWGKVALWGTLLRLSVGGESCTFSYLSLSHTLELFQRVFVSYTRARLLTRGESFPPMAVER